MADGDGGERERRDPQVWRDALTASVAFFTRLDVGATSAAPLAQAVMGFAPAGALIGVAVGLAYLLGLAFGLPPLPAALAAVAIGVALTGGLHEDGLADCADALGARGGPEQKLAVMRDARNGSFANLALIFSVGLRASALATLDGGAALAACIGAHALSRAYLPSVMAQQPLARADGMAAAAGKPDEASARNALIVGLIVAMASGVLFSIAGSILAVLLGILIMAAASGLARRAFGGYTGDVLGATQQCGEVAILLAWALAIGGT